MDNSSKTTNCTSWMDSFPGAITICDTDGIILEMNSFAKQQFSKSGGEKLIGQNLLDCHPEPANSKLKEMLAKQLQNLYITETGEDKKLIIQSPLYNGENYVGFIELSLKVADEIPLIDRNK